MITQYDKTNFKPDSNKEFDYLTPHEIKYTEEKIKIAFASGELVRILYFGGSTPGGDREISPVKIRLDSVDCYDPQDKMVKTFKINKIKITDDPSQPIPLEVSLEFLMREIQSRLSGSFSNYMFTFFNEYIVVYGKKKNSGQFKKTPLLSIGISGKKYELKMYGFKKSFAITCECVGFVDYILLSLAQDQAKEAA